MKLFIIKLHVNNTFVFTTHNLLTPLHISFAILSNIGLIAGCMKFLPLTYPPFRVAWPCSNNITIGTPFSTLEFVQYKPIFPLSFTISYDQAFAVSEVSLGVAADKAITPSIP